MTYVTEDKLVYTPILAGAQQNVVTKEVTVARGQGVLKPGAVVGMKTADKEVALCDHTQSDGSESVYGIVLNTVDATDAPAVATVAVTGEFVEDNLVFGGSTTADDVRDAAEAKNIYFRKLVNKEA